jgi:hypothetical protein
MQCAAVKVRGLGDSHWSPHASPRSRAQITTKRQWLRLVGRRHDVMFWKPDEREVRTRVPLTRPPAPPVTRAWATAGAEALPVRATLLARPPCRRRAVRRALRLSPLVGRALHDDSCRRWLPGVLDACLIAHGLLKGVQLFLPEKPYAEVCAAPCPRSPSLSAAAPEDGRSGASGRLPSGHAAQQPRWRPAQSSRVVRARPTRLLIPAHAARAFRAEAEQCFACNVKFGMMQRRHHCRCVRGRGDSRTSPDCGARPQQLRPLVLRAALRQGGAHSGHGLHDAAARVRQLPHQAQPVPHHEGGRRHPTAPGAHADAPACTYAPRLVYPSLEHPLRSPSGPCSPCVAQTVHIYNVVEHGRRFYRTVRPSDR